MAESEIPDNLYTTVVNYKDRNGLTRELHVKQPLDPDQRRMTFADIQMLAKQITIQLKEDAF